MKKKRWVVIPVLLFVIIVALFQFILFVGFVPSESMEPTLKAGSIIVASRLFDSVSVHNIVIFRHDGKLLVKRVAAVGGEEYELNGEFIVVPEGKLIMLGDNSENSFDSRYWENPCVDVSDVVAIKTDD